MNKQPKLDCICSPTQDCAYHANLKKTPNNQVIKLIAEIEAHRISIHDPYKFGLTKKFWNKLKKKYKIDK